MKDEAITQYLDAIQRETKKIDNLSLRCIDDSVQTIYTLIGTMRTDIRLNFNELKDS